MSKKHIPQLADSSEILNSLFSSPATAPSLSTSITNNPTSARTTGISYPVLVPTEKHYRQAAAAGAKEIAVFLSASESFSQRNINTTIAASLTRYRGVCAAALSAGIKVRGYISCVIACPYDGPTPPSQVTRLAQQLLDMGCYEISLGDTIGVGTPGTVSLLLQDITQHIPPSKLAGHFHDTYGMALANILVSLEFGVRVFDSSVGGLGGCPFAKGAKGNIATEDLVYMLHGSGWETGVDLMGVARIGEWISKELGRENASRAGTALLVKAKL